MNSKQSEEQMAYNVWKEYKSSVADPARMVAKIEAHQLTGNQAYTNKQQNVRDYASKLDNNKASSKASFM